MAGNGTHHRIEGSRGPSESGRRGLISRARRMPTSALKAQAEMPKSRLAVVHVVQDRRGICTTKIPQAIDKHGQLRSTIDSRKRPYAALIYI
jgi:hypothetical protein